MYNKMGNSVADLTTRLRINPIEVFNEYHKLNTLTYRICNAALTADHSLFTKIPDKFRSEEYYNIIILNQLMKFEDIPNEYQTFENYKIYYSINATSDHLINFDLDIHINIIKNIRYIIDLTDANIIDMMAIIDKNTKTDNNMKKIYMHYLLSNVKHDKLIINRMLLFNKEYIDCL